MFRILLFILVSISSIQVTMTESDWTKQCSRCSCIWVSGKKTANCSNRNFNEIPKDISTEVRDIDFSNNPLYNLNDMVFVSSNLGDVHKLKLQNCSIENIYGKAFSDLRLLIELDISRNAIKSIEKNTFLELIKIRVIILSYNNIKTLEDGLFNGLTYLRRIHLDHNEIESINVNTFQQLPILNDLSLGYNKLKTVDFDLKKQLPKLNSLNVEGNPWICDCHLEQFRQIVVRNNLITQITECAEPPKLRGVSWIEPSTFACSPLILDPLPSTQIQATSNNVTLACKVSGEPEPDVDWTNNGHIIERDPRRSKQKYFTSKSKYGEFTWNNLTITNLNYKDRGEYTCIAKNPGGEDERNIVLSIDSEAILGGAVGGMDSTALIVGLSVGLVILLVVIIVLICLFCKKTNNSTLHSKRRELDNTSDECMDMSSDLGYKKGLMTEVNPICKPPRASVPASVVSGGTEVSEVKKNLLDNESVYDCDDESRSLDFDQSLLRKSHNTLLDSDYRLNNAPYPPDLLPFPPNAPQLSPAGSNASTVVVDSRLPPHHGPQSPMHSPIYDYSSLYKTLPYSRSHSPFVQGLAVPRIPRQGTGYVTIPRRPRQQSWSSEPPPSSDIIGEPLYDNLGVRTTADGSSVQSLNKIGNDATASTPRSNRLFPMSPTTIDPIAETHETSGSTIIHPERESATYELPKKQLPTTQVESQPTINQSELKPQLNPRPQTPQKPTASQTLPRNLNSTRLTPSRMQWAMDNAEQLRSPSEKRNSIASDTPSTEGKQKKIPPRPPPKPKKRASAGPLFEDEGEDGTEV